MTAASPPRHENQRTTVREYHFAGAKLRAARALIATFMCDPETRWRHSGLGMLQAYISEGGASELRVHVWDKRLQRERIEDAGLLHDHRFDMTSTLLLGIMRHQEVHLEPYEERTRDGFDPFEDAYAMYEIRSNYRRSKGGAEIVELPGAWSARFRNLELKAGDQYDFPRGAFHGTYTPCDVERWGPTVTVVRKTNQVDAPARLVAPCGVPVVHAFDSPAPEAEWRPILEQAVAAMRGANEEDGR